MSWEDTCSNCGEHRADCDCGDWNGYERKRKNRKYYFITYSANSNSIHDNYVADIKWNAVIDESPMSYIKRIERMEEGTYRNFVVLNVHEISEIEYNKYKNEYG